MPTMMVHSAQHWLQSLSTVQNSMLVEHIAFGFRILSYIIISPLIIVGILDIVAYVIARTLQAFDHLPHVKLGHSHADIIINEEERLSSHKKLGDLDLDDPTNKGCHPNSALEEVERKKKKGSIDSFGSDGSINGSYYDGGRSSDDRGAFNNNNLKTTTTSYPSLSSPYGANEELSGVGLFSPAPTRPATPTIRHEKRGSDAAGTSTAMLGSSFFVPSTTPGRD